jgi:ribose transport system substrate-binding protein
MKKHPTMPIVYKRAASLTREEGLRNAEDILTAHPDIRAIYCGNDELALGAAQAAAAKKAGILITGLNGIPPALKAVAAGEMDLTIQLNPLAWGNLGVDTMARYLKGERPKEKVFIKHVLVDKSNVAQFLPKK